MPESPIPRFEAWLDELGDRSFVLATATPEGAPSARVVLLKEVADGELVFGTTLSSRKGRELLANPLVSAVFHWADAGRQVRVSGRARVCEEAESDRVWHSRGRDSRVVETVTDEGAPLADPDAFTAAFHAADAALGDVIERPPHWAAVRIAPETVEFWTAHERRLSERELWVREGERWSRGRIQP